MSPKIKIIFFDAGGTLLHPAQSIGETYAAVARQFGEEWDGQKLERAFRQVFKKRTSSPAETDIEAAPRDHKGWWKEVVKEILLEVDPKPHFAFDDYFEHLFEFFARPEVWRVYPEVMEVLTQLKKSGYRLAVLSNWDSRLHRTLEGLGLTPFFDHCFISAEMGSDKPQPAIYQLALEKSGFAPSEALMVGDEKLNDVEAPKAQGWEAVLIERPENDLRVVEEFLKVGMLKVV